MNTEEYSLGQFRTSYSKIYYELLFVWDPRSILNRGSAMIVFLYYFYSLTLRPIMDSSRIKINWLRSVHLHTVPGNMRTIL